MVDLSQHENTAEERCLIYQTSLEATSNTCINLGIGGWHPVLLRDRPFNLKGGGRGGYGFLFRSKKNFQTTQELEYLFFPEFNIRLYDKNSESDFFFSLHQNQNIFFSNIGNQNIFLEKNHNPPFKLNGRSLNRVRRSPVESGGLILVYMYVK